MCASNRERTSTARRTGGIVTTTTTSSSVLRQGDALGPRNALGPRRETHDCVLDCAGLRSVSKRLRPCLRAEFPRGNVSPKLEEKERERGRISKRNGKRASGQQQQQQQTLKAPPPPIQPCRHRRRRDPNETKIKNATGGNIIIIAVAQQTFSEPLRAARRRVSHLQPPPAAPSLFVQKTFR